ncbi:hypothetical protein EVAR_102099_1 [Eumeta japonica]|uniref:Uncharacterized protein n=1 Tax=Eumeta variegata TaxID=151549 RepID=A0A4C1TZN4_EUMVA|nr:hypothetical protein EVAR_102099_1 [Eumeta japonica]
MTALLSRAIIIVSLLGRNRIFDGGGGMMMAGELSNDDDDDDDDDDHDDDDDDEQCLFQKQSCTHWYKQVVKYRLCGAAEKEAFSNIDMQALSRKNPTTSETGRMTRRDVPTERLYFRPSAPAHVSHQ